MMLSMYNGISPLMALAFPASMTYGFIVVFLPAGIGIREGILASFLVAGGLTPENALTISVISRFWFVAGELFLFLLARVMKLSITGKADHP